MELEEKASLDKINQAKEREAAEEAAKIKKEQEVAAAAAAKLAEQQRQEMLKKQQMAKQQSERSSSSSNASVHSMPSVFAAAFTQKPPANPTPITTATAQMMDQEELAEVVMKPSVGTKTVEKKKGPSKSKSNEPKVKSPTWIPANKEKSVGICFTFCITRRKGC